MKKLFTLLAAVIGLTFNAQVYSENFGYKELTSDITTYSGFQNSLPITYNFTNSVSIYLDLNKEAKYPDASSKNILQVSPTSSFTIEGINTSSVSSSNLQMSLGHKKFSSSTTMKIEVADMTQTTPVWTKLNFTRATTSTWELIFPTGTIPSTTNLAVRFTNMSASDKFYIDDVKIYDRTAPVISSENNVNFNKAIKDEPNSVQRFIVSISGNNVTPPTYSISGTDASMFSVVSNNLTTSGGSLDIAFSPTSTGAKSAILTITSGATTQNINLTADVMDNVNPYGLVEGTPVTSLYEDFESYANKATAFTGWSNFAQGLNQIWYAANYSDSFKPSGKVIAFDKTYQLGYYKSLFISPAINLDEISKNNVKFDFRGVDYGVVGSIGSLLNVYLIKLVNGQPMQKNLIKTINTMPSTFVTETLDLTSYSGVGFLAFELVASSVQGDSNVYYIDNITAANYLDVKNTVKSKNVFLKNTIVEEALSFETKGNATVRVYNANGQLVKTATISAQNANVNVATLPKGNYVVTAELNGEKVSQKVIKK